MKISLVLYKGYTYENGKKQQIKGNCDVCNQQAIWLTNYGKTDEEARGLKVSLCQNCLDVLKENEKMDSESR
jgi:hypothetical protein